MVLYRTFHPSQSYHARSFDVLSQYFFDLTLGPEVCGMTLPQHVMSVRQGWSLSPAKLSAPTKTEPNSVIIEE